MKKVQLFLTLMVIALTSITVTINAQITNAGIYFQAVARDNYSNPAKDRKIYVQSTLLQSTATGTRVLIEQFQVSTDNTGVFAISVGQGTRTGGTVSGLQNIDWSKGPYFLNLKVAITPESQSIGWDYTKELVDIGTTSFGAVPYALYAGTAAGLDAKLSTTDTTKMLAAYAKAMAVQSLTTAVSTKLSVADTTAMLAPYSKAVAALVTSNLTSLTAKAVNDGLNSKVNLADSTSVFVTPTQLANITLPTSIVDAGTLTGTTLKSTVTESSLISVGTLANLTVTNPIVGSITGNAATASTATSAGTATTATKLATARNINGIAFDGSGDITLPTSIVDAGTLTGTTLKSTVTESSLTSVGTLANLTVTNPIVGSITGNAATASSATTAGSASNANYATSAGTISGTLSVNNGGTGQNTIAGLQSILGLTGSEVTIGDRAGQTNQASAGIAIGTAAGQTNQGSQSISIGYVAGNINQGTNSVAIGSNAAQSSQGTQSVALGYAANSAANNATAIGASSSSPYTNSTAIGYQAATTANNTIQLGADGVTVPGSTAISNVRTSGTLTAGAVTYPNSHGTANQVLTTTGTGTLTWTTPNSMPNASTLSGTTLNPTITGSSLTSVGTITSGVWSGTAISVANGGTGVTTLTGLVKGNGTSAFTSAISGTDYQAPITLTTTGTGAATLSGTTLNIPTPVTSGSTTYTIGSYPELGGYVFYVTPNGKHGLVAETQNQVTGGSIFDIFNNINNPNNHSTSGKEFTDWRIPTLWEMQKMFLKRDQIGTWDYNYYYFTTSNYTTQSTGYVIDASNGASGSGYSAPLSVRAIRSF